MFKFLITPKRWLRFEAVALMALALLLGSMMPMAAAKPTTATALEIVTKDEITRFLAELTAETTFTATVLSEPYRVIIDLADVRFNLPAGVGRKPKGLIRQVRYGVIEKGKSRIVIDTSGPVLIKQSQLLPRKGKQKPRIAIDLIATDSDSFAALHLKDVQAASPEVTASLPLIMPAVPAPAKPDGRRVIVIDPGHGGMDPGAMSPRKTKEKDVVFAFALALQKALAASGQYDVQLTRQQDRFMTLNDRVAFTKRATPALFIAIHADTVRGKTARGTTIYTLSDTASDEEAEALALKENRTDIIAGVNLADQVGEVADVLIELVQRESRNHASLFSQAALEALKDVTTMTGKPLRSAGFVVLKVPDVPSVLIELGYLSSVDDERNLKDPVWQDKMAVALAQAVDRHFATLDAAE
jgi:N-acetylmuramoyl-L-alanine amidase